MPSLTITDHAATKGVELLASDGAERAEPALRVIVKGGGCSGLMTHMEFVDAAGSEDERFEHNGFKVVIDKKSLFFLGGSVLDYKDGLTGAGFKFENPNASNTCGCGESFSV
jgi:iron-sulfur cluster assembly protein